MEREKLNLRDGHLGHFIVTKSRWTFGLSISMQRKKESQLLFLSGLLS